MLCLVLWAAPGAAAAPGSADTEDGSRHEAAREETLAELATRAAEVRARLDRLYERADERVLEYTAAAERLEEAEDRSESAARAAERARERTEGAREEAADYAAAAYMGAGLGPAQAWSSPGGPQEVLDRGSDLALIGHRRGTAVDTAGAALSAADTLSDRAEEAEDERRDAAEEAADAKEAALEAVAEQEESLAGITAEQSRVQRKLDRARDGTGQLEQRRRQALDQAQAAAGPAASAPPEATGGADGAAAASGGGTDASGGQDGAVEAAGGCKPSDAGGHPNGRIPDSALCPLPQPGESLQAEAAAAFIELDGAFRERFGRPMCVTDSYRPFSEQVRLFRERAAGKAASPGTSAHGRGRAVDLCGGVNRHGSQEYAWMAANAPDRGWHNPPWAQDGFEPWHWEYTG